MSPQICNLLNIFNSRGTFTSSLNVIIALTVVMTIFSSLIQGHPTPRDVIRRRWLNPCGGQNQVVVDSSSPVDHYWQADNSGSTSAPLRDLVGEMNETVDRLRVLHNVTQQLKTLLGERHNGNNEHLDEYLSYVLVIEGLRGPRQPANLSAATLTESEVDDLLRSAYEEFSRVSIFLNQSKTDEREGAIGASFEQIYTRIERGDRNHNTGIFPILCNLHRLMDQRKQILTNDIISNITAIMVPTGSPVFKLSRDWIILSRLEHLIVDVERAFVEINKFSSQQAQTVQINA